MNSLNQTRPGWDTVLTETYRLYGGKFWRFFAVALPPVVLTYAVNRAWSAGIHTAIRQGILHGPFNGPTLVVLGVLGFLEWGSYWLISAFFFAAVAGQTVRSEQSDEAPLSDFFSAARERLGPVLAVGLLTWTLMFVAGRGAAMIITFGLGNLVHGPMSTVWFTVLVLTPNLIVAALLSRMGLAIPELIDKPEISWRQALRNSLRATENWEIFFGFFLIKSALMAYALLWLADRALDLLWRRQWLPDAAFPWVAPVLTIVVAALVESPLFLSFCVLYRETRNGSAAATPRPIG